MSCVSLTSSVASMSYFWMCPMSWPVYSLRWLRMSCYILYFSDNHKVVNNQEACCSSHFWTCVSGVWLESWPGHWFSWGFSWFPSVILCKFKDSTSLHHDFLHYKAVFTQEIIHLRDRERERERDWLLVTAALLWVFGSTVLNGAIFCQRTLHISYLLTVPDAC